MIENVDEIKLPKERQARMFLHQRGYAFKRSAPISVYGTC